MDYYEYYITCHHGNGMLPAAAVIGAIMGTTGMTIMCREDHSVCSDQTIVGQKEEYGGRRIEQALEGTL